MSLFTGLNESVKHPALRLWCKFALFYTWAVTFVVIGLYPFVGEIATTEAPWEEVRMPIEHGENLQWDYVPLPDESFTYWAFVYGYWFQHQFGFISLAIMLSAVGVMNWKSTYHPQPMGDHDKPWQEAAFKVSKMRAVLFALGVLILGATAVIAVRHDTVYGGLIPTAVHISKME